MEKQSIGKLAVKGGLWVFSIQAITRILTITKLIIVARILAPQDFGTMGIALLTLSILDVFSKTGFFEKLIQEKSDITEYLDTAWSILLIRGIILSTIIFFISNPIAIFFRNPEAAKVIKLLAISPILTGAVNIGIVYFQRELQFQKQFIYDVCGAITNFVVVIVSAIILRNVIALVIGIIAENAVRFIVSFLISPYRPKFEIDLKALKRMYKFGRWVFGSNILVFITTQGDDIFVGKVLGTFSLGLYQMAYKISNTASTEIVNVISKVIFPVYSKLQNDIKKMKKVYLKVLQLTAFLAIPLSFLIIILAKDGTIIFLGKKWLEIVPAMRVLAVAGLMRALPATSGYLFYSIGKPYIDTKFQIVRLIVLTIFIYPLTSKFGIIGTSYAVLASISIVSISFIIKVSKTTQCKFKEILTVIGCPLVAATALIIMVVCIQKIIVSTNILRFILEIIAGITTYFLVLLGFGKIYNIKGTLKYTIELLQSKTNTSDTIYDS